MTYIILLTSVALSGLAQLSWKVGMSGIQEINIMKILFNKFIILGFVLYGIGVILRLYILSKLEVSFAYPFVAVSFIIVAVGGYFFGDNFNLFKIVGIGLILLGVFFLSRSS